MLTKFNTINARTYKDFKWPHGLADFRRYNLIYGWNGSGKTTLSDIFRMIEKRQASDGHGIQEFSFTYNNKTIKHTDLKENAVNLPSIRVFNRTFIDKNVFDEKAGASLIVVIGEENIYKQEELEQKRKNLKDLEQKLNKEKKEKSSQENEFKNFCQEKASEIRNRLGITNPKDYDFKKFKDTCGNLIHQNDKTNRPITSEELESLEKTAKSSPLSEIPNILIDIPDLEEITTKVDNLLKRTVVNQIIPKLKNDPTLSSWVEQGLEIHRNLRCCEFCQNELSETRIRQLENHFNKQFKELEFDIDQTIQEICKHISSLEKTEKDLVDSAKFYPDCASAYANAKEEFSKRLSKSVDFLKAACRTLKEKQKRPFTKLSFDEEVPDCIKKQAKKVNLLIEKHNNQSENHHKTVKDAKEAFISAVAKNSLGKYQEHFNKLETLENEVKEDEKIKKTDEEEASALESKLVNHRKPAEELNKDLKEYLGHGELNFEAQETGYRILRGNNLALSLSEGEKTAIALLYFLKSLEDKEFNLEQGIVVIDDPVSSLDQTALFGAFGYIKKRTCNAKQLFILTHNFSFFSQVRNWFSYKKKEVSYYQTSCLLENAGRTSQLRKLDKLLQDYESEYHYLFSLIVKASKNKGAPLEEYYHMPNVARRVLECFLSFRMPNKGNLHEKVKGIFGENSEKATRVLRFIDFNSHGNNNFSPSQHDNSILSETSNVMSDLLYIIAAVDERHHKHMQEILI